jgi:hypothetical protein
LTLADLSAAALDLRAGKREDCPQVIVDMRIRHVSVERATERFAASDGHVSAGKRALRKGVRGRPNDWKAAAASPSSGVLGPAFG